MSEFIQGRLLVGPGATAKKHYELVHLEFASADGPITINLIPIAVVTAEARLLVAAPEASWSKHPAGRLFPSRGLQKPILVEVAAATMEEPEEALAEESIKLWVGLLDPKLEKKLKAGGSMHPTADVWDVESEPGLIPHGPSLAEVAEDHFAFLSAQSGGEEDPELAEVAEDEKVGDRLQRLEQMMEKLLDGQPASSGTLIAANPKPASRPPGLKVQPKGSSKMAAGSSVLDPTVVASALEAGIPQEQLDVLGGLLKKTSRMQDLPRPAQTRRKSVLSESEDEEREEAEEKGGDAEEEKEGDLPGGPVEKAVMQLTKIVNSLAKRRDKKKDLEEFLDEASTGDSSTSTSSSRSKAAAYKRLRSALVNKPEALVSMLEEAMEEDFLQLRAGPGSDLRGTSARAWLEHRSKLQYYPGSIRQAWILGGIYDCLANGRVAEAKARSLLGVAALDQASLDGGNWLMAQEMLLEPAAPFAAFQGRRLPEAWEQTVTKLVDERWAEILMWKLKDKDSFNEARKRLSIGKNPNAALPAKDGQIVDPNPKKGGKGGKGGKPGQPKGASEAEGKD